MFLDLQNGISICLMFLEFFSMSAQRSALSVVASCCHDIVCVDDFRFIRDSLNMLIARLTQQVCSFYRAMHFSANARYWDRMSSVRLFVCPSVCPSVTLVDCDHIGWKSWKLINGQLA